MDRQQASVCAQFRGLARDAHGNVLPLTAVGIILIAAMIGGGVDMSRSYMAKNRLQAACDAATLAGRRAITTHGYDTAARAQADAYFNVDYDQSRQGTRLTSFTSSSSDSDNQISGAATTTVDMLIMKLFGYRTIKLNVTCSVTMGVGNSDVTMVLDNTGSMDNKLSGSQQTRIQALRAAMKNFYATVQTATAGSNARIRYAFVPFSTTVNVGHLLYDLNPDYIVDSYPTQSRVPIYHTVTTNVLAGSDPVTGDPVYHTVSSEVFDHWEYRQVIYDTSLYKTFQAVSQPVGADVDGTGGAMVASTWRGCIAERKTVRSATFSFSTLLGMNPMGAEDLDIDSEPTGDPDTKWAPLWPEVAFYRTTATGAKTNAATSTAGIQAAFYCPAKATTLAAMSQKAFGDYADSLVSTGNTYHDIGMIWGGRISSPDGIFQDIVNVKPVNGGSVSRHIIYMTDGEPQANNLTLQAYGIEYHDRRITDNGTSNEDARHVARFRAVCDEVKSKGIRIWVIAFAANMTSDLSYCASGNSAFTASSSAQLNEAFQEIAKQVGELRVVK